MLHSAHHVNPNAFVVRSRIESNSFVNERLMLIDLTEFGCFGICPHSVTVDTIKFQGFGMVARDLKSIHVDRLTAE